MSVILKMIRKRRLAQQMHSYITRLSPMLDPYVSCDEWGDYVEGFRSQAIPVRAREPREDHEPQSRPWFESEAARLLLRVLADDALGDRTLVHYHPADGAEAEIVRRARLMVAEWVNSV